MMKALQVLAALRVMRLVTYLDVAASTFFVFDYFLTLGLELQYVWKRGKWSSIHALFVVQRYLPFVDTVFLVLYHQVGASMTAEQCKIAYYMSAFSMTIGIGVGEAILSLRTWAVWNRSKRVGVALVFLFVGIWGVMFFVVTGFLRSLAFGDDPYPGFRGCFVIRANHSMIIVWCLLMAWDTIILAFMLGPGIKHYRAGSTSALINVIYRDGLMYYIYLCALSSVNIAVVRALPYSYQHLLTSTERAFHSAISSRVLLDIRATLDAPYNLTELVAGAYDSDDTSINGVRESGGPEGGLIFAQRSASGIELRERISNPHARADAECRGDDCEMVPGGRVTPLPRK
ncbi:hypothetical protein D9619_010159 [Psilocybe cf. subviscida]|uniref:DUF6533 domain-containing protein n=1 Tax=Psilocybe cf. subviscida TaxID=2480587 RepID=A0A8H5ES23_9AGAR|nr:hypothetical protein D9619_010159 [Psilocybe cf. subviscida]